MLLGISFWLNLGAFGLLALYTLIAWMMIGDAVSGSSSSAAVGAVAAGAGTTGRCSR